MSLRGVVRLVCFLVSLVFFFVVKVLALVGKVEALVKDDDSEVIALVVGVVEFMTDAVVFVERFVWSVIGVAVCFVCFVCFVAVEIFGVVKAFASIEVFGPDDDSKIMTLVTVFIEFVKDDVVFVVFFVWSLKGVEGAFFGKVVVALVPGEDLVVSAFFGKVVVALVPGEDLVVSAFFGKVVVALVPGEDFVLLGKCVEAWVPEDDSVLFGKIVEA